MGVAWFLATVCCRFGERLTCPGFDIPFPSVGVAWFRSDCLAGTCRRQICCWRSHRRETRRRSLRWPISGCRRAAAGPFRRLETRTRALDQKVRVCDDSQNHDSNTVVYVAQQRVELVHRTRTLERVVFPVWDGSAFYSQRKFQGESCHFSTRLLYFPMKAR